jgi:arsenate reductase (thioredoxin)
MKTKPKVLFLCTGNSCRSQMAEGWAKALLPDAVEAYSAGVEPHGLNPLAVQVMAESGVDISAQLSKHVSELQGFQFDFVITVCDHAHETCPILPGAHVIHMPFDDPPRLAKEAKTADEALSHYRRVRDDIKGLVAGLPANLGEDQHG